MQFCFASFTSSVALRAFLLLTLSAASAVAESRLTNVSVRSVAGSDSETLIVGFAISGPGTKSMLVRGVGPELSRYGVPDIVMDPELRLYSSGSEVIAENDNWGGSSSLSDTFASVGAFPLPANSKDAAILRPLSAGNYFVHAASRSGPGVALVEAYAVDSATGPALTNVSARSFSGRGASVLTVGFSITGSGHKTVLIRGVGAALTRYGVTGVLDDPKLTLFSEHETVLGTNDNWLPSAGWGQAFTAVGAFPLRVGTRDSALVVSLLPGNYTAQVSGANATSGVSLIEVYDLANLLPSTVYVLQPVENEVPERFWAYLPTGERVAPIPISKQPPTYPYAARVAAIEGEANILFVVGTSGSVTDAMILDATDLPLGQSALSAVRSWKFQPGTVNGKTAPILMLVPIIFQLNQG